MDELLQAVRKACSPKLWSIGVTLARGDRVTLEKDQVTLRVSAPQLAVPYVVELDIADQAWGCDCPSREDPCAHVAAAAIALKEARSGAKTLVTSERKKKSIAYDLRRTDLGLTVARSLVGEGAPEKLTSIEASTRALESTVDLEIGENDPKIERILERNRKLESGHVAEIVGLLHGNPRVMLDGQRLIIDKTPLLPRARVRAEGQALVFAIEKDPSVEEIVLPGVARAAGKLRPLGETALGGMRWEKLPSVRRFERAAWAELAGELVPLMEPRMAVEVETDLLPRLVVHTPPRIDLGLVFHPKGFSVDPALVYGRPAQIKIQQKKAVYLQGPVPRRDLSAEGALLERLRDALNLVPGRRVELVGPDAQVFMEKLRDWNEESDLVEQVFDLDLRGGPLEPRLVLEDDGRFDVRFERTEGGQADARAVVDAWRGGFGMVPLFEGGFAPLPLGWLEKNGHRLIALLAARDERGELPVALLPDLALLAQSLDAPPPPGLDRLRPLIEGFDRIPRAVLPPDLVATLRHYQEIGVDWLAFLRSAGLGAVLADDMGLGKTLQTIAVIDGRTLVVCPTSVVHNWIREISRFRPGLKVCLYHGPKRAMDATANVVITTYPLLRLDLELLLAEKWGMVVLDEAQAIKNPDSQSARAAFALRASFRVSLSGTPLENQLEELWSQLHFTNPGLLGGRRDFDERYARPIGEGNPGRAAELRQRIKPFVLRRMKQEVAPELPPRSDMILYAELSESERQVYDAVHAATQREVVARLDAGGSVLGVLEALLRLRQAACHSALVPGQTAESSSKLEALIDALQQVAAEGHRALVFSQWTSFLDLAEKELKKASLGFVRLDGATIDRASVVDRFQRPDGPPVFLISLKAGGTGLNLTAADHVFFLDPWWNPAVEQQAADRAHRIGQDKPVFVYRVVARDTVEEKILVLQDKKRALADVALGGAEQASQMTREDLLALLA